LKINGLTIGAVGFLVQKFNRRTVLEPNYDQMHQKLQSAYAKKIYKKRGSTDGQY
jgi:hypothetical protein